MNLKALLYVIIVFHSLIYYLVHFPYFVRKDSLGDLSHLCLFFLINCGIVEGFS